MHKFSMNGQGCIEFSSAISTALRKEALGHGGFTCRMCGLGPGEIDSATGQRASLHIERLVDFSLGGKNQISNLQAVCSICAEGRASLTMGTPSPKWLLTQVRRARPDEQRQVLDWLRKKFEE